MSSASSGTTSSVNEETARLLSEGAESLYDSYGAASIATPPDSPPRRGARRSSSDGSYNNDQSPTPGARTHLATEDSVEIIRTESANVQILTDDNQEEDDDGDETTREEGTIAQLTRRLRCLFSAITWPIVPLGTLVSFALLWVLYASFVMDLHRSCSHPLHWYAIASLLVVSYAPQHHKVRAHLFHYSRERDGPVRPPGVRMYDQLFHTLCIIYVYGGVTLIQTCRQDMGDDENGQFDKQGTEAPSSSSSGDDDTPEPTINTCAATCPHLYDALVVYVTTLELFTFALILPLLFLPCIYLWILRRATAEAEAFADLQERLDEEEAYLRNGGITTQELMDSLEPVKLVRRGDNFVDSQVILMPARSGSAWSKDGSNLKECCICMSEFVVSQPDADIESGLGIAFPNISSSKDEGLSPSASDDESTRQQQQQDDEDAMVRTKCGHVFHQKCLAGWIGGRWEPHPQPQDESTTESRAERRRRRARRTCCPLCRADLKPIGSGSATADTL